MRDCIVVNVTKIHFVDLTVADVQLAWVLAVLRMKAFDFVSF